MNGSAAATSPCNLRQFLRIREAARLLALSELSVRRFIRAGELRAARFGRTLRVSAEELQRFAASRTR